MLFLIVNKSPIVIYDPNFYLIGVCYSFFRQKVSTSQHFDDQPEKNFIYSINKTLFIDIHISLMFFYINYVHIICNTINAVIVQTNDSLHSFFVNSFIHLSAGMGVCVCGCKVFVATDTVGFLKAHAKPMATESWFVLLSKTLYNLVEWMVHFCIDSMPTWNRDKLFHINWHMLMIQICL